ncbi:MAG: tRNA pseudouridine(55) synthase TruB [Thermomicrobiales bacterium]
MSDGARPALDGYLVIDKPAGWTSFDVVARARRLLGEKKVGHAGTLDPAATGVLPLAVGHATKTLEYLANASKSYLAEVTFGVETDSHDIDGVVTATRDAGWLTVGAIDGALPAFRGPIEQIPPMHSAIKIKGQRLYELARRGEEIERAPRPVTIHRLDLVAWAPPVATLWIDCSKGTYIRSLARDLGEALGTGAFMSNLVRYRTGPFHLCEALTIHELAESDLPWAWPELAAHPDSVMLDLPALLLDDALTLRWRQGSAIPADGVAAGDCRAYSSGGEWLGIGRADERGQAWKPAKVIGSAS